MARRASAKVTPYALEPRLRPQRARQGALAPLRSKGDCAAEVERSVRVARRGPAEVGGAAGARRRLGEALPRRRRRRRSCTCLEQHTTCPTRCNVLRRVAKQCTSPTVPVAHDRRLQLEHVVLALVVRDHVRRQPVRAQSRKGVIGRPKRRITGACDKQTRHT